MEWIPFNLFPNWESMPSVEFYPPIRVMIMHSEKPVKDYIRCKQCNTPVSTVPLDLSKVAVTFIEACPDCELKNKPLKELYQEYLNDPSEQKFQTLLERMISLLNKLDTKH